MQECLESCLPCLSSRGYTRVAQSERKKSEKEYSESVKSAVLTLQSYPNCRPQLTNASGLVQTLRYLGSAHTHPRGDLTNIKDKTLPLSLSDVWEWRDNLEDKMYEDKLNGIDTSGIVGRKVGALKVLGEHMYGDEFLKEYENDKDRWFELEQMAGDDIDGEEEEGENEGGERMAVGDHGAQRTTTSGSGSKQSESSGSGSWFRRQKFPDDETGFELQELIGSSERNPPSGSWRDV